MLIYLIFTTLAESLVMVAISSSTEKKNYATLMFIILFIALDGISRIFAILLGDNFFLRFNPDQILLAIYFGINHLTPNYTQISSFTSIITPISVRRTLLSFQDGIETLLFYMAISMLFIYRRINKIWR